MKIDLGSINNISVDINIGMQSLCQNKAIIDLNSNILTIEDENILIGTDNDESNDENTTDYNCVFHKLETCLTQGNPLERIKTLKLNHKELGLINYAEHQINLTENKIKSTKPYLSQQKSKKL